MTREDKLRALREMDAVIERAGEMCRSYELAQMEMMATLARVKAIYRQMFARKAELQKLLEETEG